MSRYLDEKIKVEVKNAVDNFFDLIFRYGSWFKKSDDLNQMARELRKQLERIPPEEYDIIREFVHIQGFNPATTIQKGDYVLDGEVRNTTFPFVVMEKDIIHHRATLSLNMPVFGIALKNMTPIQAQIFVKSRREENLGVQYEKHTKKD